MQAADLSPKSVRTYVGTLQAIFGAAVDSDLLARSPVRPRTLGLARVRRPERATLTADELLRLAGAMPPRYRALVLLAGTVGLRWGEAIGLRVGDVDVLRRQLSVRQTEDLAANQLDRYRTILVFDVADLVAAGFEVVPTFRTPHVTIAFAGDLDERVATLEALEVARRMNPYHVDESSADDQEEGHR